MNKKDWKISKRLKSFVYAFKGIRALFSQPNACIHSLIACIVIICGIWLGISSWEWCIVSLCIGAVLMAEALNSALEAIADKVSPEFDSLIGKAKDLAAGGVLLMVLGAVVAGIIIYVPKFINIFTN